MKHFETNETLPTHETVWLTEHASGQFSQAQHLSRGPWQPPVKNYDKMDDLEEAEVGIFPGRKELYTPARLKIHPCQEVSFSPAARALAYPEDLLLLLSDLPRGALKGGQRSCSGGEVMSKALLVKFCKLFRKWKVTHNVNHLINSFLCWEGHLLHLLHLHLSKPLRAEQCILLNYLTSSLKTTLLFRSPRASESRSVVTKFEGNRPCAEDRYTDAVQISLDEKEVSFGG